jgi:uncharacterized protein (DUF2062 family)
MPRKLLRKYLPDTGTLKNHRHLRLFGRLLHDPNLFHLNRRSVSGGFFVGMLCAFTPIFPQMLTSAALAILFRVNLPISVALVWITNPFTIPPIFYACYLIGSWILGRESEIEDFQMSPEWIESMFDQIWQPLLLGGLVTGVVTGIISYMLMRLFWRWHVLNHLAKRRAKRRANSNPPTTEHIPSDME